LTYAVLLAGTSRLTQPVALAICSFAIGAVSGFVAATPTALTSDQVEPSQRGVAIGWLRTMSDAGQIVGPLAMGVLADTADISAPFLFGAALLAITAWLCHRRAPMIAAARGRES
jgi:MFS family permease